MTLGLQNGSRSTGLTTLCHHLKAHLGSSICLVLSNFSCTSIDLISLIIFISGIYGFGSYLAPEFLIHGIVDEKTDVFAFGVLLLELISGRRALDYSQQSLVMWVCHGLL